MGNARSASYSYSYHQQQQQQEQWLLGESSMYHQTSLEYNNQDDPHHYPYWQPIEPAENEADYQDVEFKSAESSVGMGVVIRPVMATPPPLPFIRHRNAPIRQPRTSLQLQRGRALSLSCSVMATPGIDDDDDNCHAIVVDQEDVKIQSDRRFITSSPSSTMKRQQQQLNQTTDAVSNGGGGGGRMQHGRAASCTALIQCRDAIDRLSIAQRFCHEQQPHQDDDNELADSIGNHHQRQQRGNSPAPFRRRQFLSLRSHPSRQSQRHRRPLTAATSTLNRTLSVRSSSSLPIQRSGSSASLQLVHQQQSSEMKAYLESARLKKLSVEQSLKSSSSSISTKQSPNCWTTTTFSRESLEDGGYTTTLTIGEDEDDYDTLVRNNSNKNRSHYDDDSGDSHLTMQTANTSLSSGYHAAIPPTVHPRLDDDGGDDDHQDGNSSSYYYSNETDDGPGDGGGGGEIPHQYHPFGGSVSGLFYVDWLRQQLGIVPPYIELRHGRLHLKLVQDDVMEHIDGAVRVSEIIELLRAEYGIVTGGRSREGRPIITFPDRCNFATLTEDNYRKLIVYLTSVPALHDADLGYVLIVDRRGDRWNAVKATLLRLSSFFPGLIAVVYVLRPSGLLQKAISEVSNKFFRDDFKFKVVVCSCLEELHQRIDTSQLTSELGGSLFYSHQEWIDTRMAVESFSANTTDIGAALRKFSRRLQDTELPNDVPATQAVLQHQSQEYAALKTELRNANAQGETLLSLIKKPACTYGSNASPALVRRNDPWPGQLVNVTTVERLLIQMDETQKTLDEFWNKHAAHLKLCLQLRQYELDFRELQVALNDDIQTVSRFANDGDSVSIIDSLLQQTFDCRSRCQIDLDRADSLFSHATKLMNDYSDSPVVLDSVRPKSIELNRMSQTLHELFIGRIETLQRSRDLYHRIEKANQWCSQGVDLLASQQLEKCSSSDFAIEALSDIEQFLNSSEFHNSKDVHILFQDVVTPETKSLINQVIQRVQDVQIMCERRLAGLRQIVSRIRISRPILSVPPEPILMSSLDRRQSTVESVDMANNRQSSAGVKLRHVLTELLETERIYVTEINLILKGYRDQLIDPDPYQPPPTQLVEKVDVLFGNLPEIHAFHGQILLPDLESSLDSPQLVASCFLRHTGALHELYSYYCQNIPQSEELRRQIGEQNNLFLRQCQVGLGHKLPLSAYLLKPVQRITKYQLLLKDLMKYSSQNDESLTEDMDQESDLPLALDAMLAVLRCVNDSMHQVAISGYQGSLAELGRLLLQGGFSIWTEGKRDRLRELRLKAMQRHVFLYERAVVFCKRVGKDPDKATYQFKHLLKMSEVGLTETVHSGKGSDARKFELWLQGRHEVWVLQAPARDVKETWITEIKRVLLNQFHQLKGQTMSLVPRVGGINASSGGSHHATSGGPQGVISNGQKISQHSASIPNGSSHPSSPFGHKSLRPTSSCSWEYNGGVGSISSGTPGSSGSAEDRNSMGDTIASSSTSRASTGSRMLRSTTVDEDDGWSTDFSLSDEEMGSETYLDHVEPLRRRYVALADYAPLGPTEAALKEGDILDVVRIGCAGWWYVRPSVSNSSSMQGWAPSAYLEAVPLPSSNLKSPCSSGTPSVSSQDSEHDHLQ